MIRCCFALNYSGVLFESNLVVGKDVINMGSGFSRGESINVLLAVKRLMQAGIDVLYLPGIRNGVEIPAKQKRSFHIFLKPLQGLFGLDYTPFLRKAEMGYGHDEFLPGVERQRRLGDNPRPCIACSSP